MKDPDLIFLEECDNEQLKALIDILVFDKDGKKRFSEEISSTQKFIQNYPNNNKALIPEIINEIQLFGGNTIANKLRGHGIPYREVLEDVCDRVKVNYNKKLPTDILERELLKKIAVSTIDKMTEEDIKKFDANLNKDRLMKAVMNDNGPILAAISAIVVQQLSKQAAQKGALMLFGRVLAPRVLVFAVPVLNALAILWTFYDIAGPAYRVTIPFVMTVALLRSKLLSTDEYMNNIFA